jgi:hypothetical protein
MSYEEEDTCHMGRGNHSLLAQRLLLGEEGRERLGRHEKEEGREQAPSFLDLAIAIH